MGQELELEHPPFSLDSFVLPIYSLPPEKKDHMHPV
jgi:hypothetical protein